MKRLTLREAKIWDGTIRFYGGRGMYIVSQVFGDKICETKKEGAK